jgi:hypothetical protein
MVTPGFVGSSSDLAFALPVRHAGDLGAGRSITAVAKSNARRDLDENWLLGDRQLEPSRPRFEFGARCCGTRTTSA